MINTGGTVDGEDLIWSTFSGLGESLYAKKNGGFVVLNL